MLEFLTDISLGIRNLPAPTLGRVLNFLAPGLCGPLVLVALLGEGTGFEKRFYTAAARLDFGTLTSILFSHGDTSINAWALLFLLAALSCELWWLTAIYAWKSSLKDQVASAWEKLAVSEKILLVEGDVGFDHLQSQLEEFLQNNDRGAYTHESAVWIAQAPALAVLILPVLIAFLLWFALLIFLIPVAVLAIGLEYFGLDKVNVLVTGVFAFAALLFLHGYAMYCDTSPMHPYGAEVVIRDELQHTKPRV